jgi:hypothetical protein
MDITQFFQKKSNNKNNNNNKNKNKNITNDKVNFLKVLAKLINTGVIDMLEYTHMLNFAKSDGDIVNMGRYNQIYKNIVSSSKVNSMVKDDFINLTNTLYSHLHNVFGHNITLNLDDVNISGLLDNIINHNKGILQFSNDQLISIKHICYFLYNDVIKTYGIYGYAGTGKTTLITKLIYYLILNKYIKSVAFTAPTNIAVDIMKAKFKDDINKLLNNNNNNTNNIDDQLDILQKQGINISFLTVHKLLNFKNDFDVDGERIFVKGKQSTIYDYDLVVIDECSMISLQMIIHIFEDIRCQVISLGKGDVVKRVPKVLFLGDPAQLPPVNEKTSIVFAKNKNEFNVNLFNRSVRYDNNDNNNNNDNNDNNNNNNNINNNRFLDLQKEILNQQSFTLTQIMRSNDNNVINLCNEIREWIMNPKKIPMISRHVGKKVKLYKYQNNSDKLNTKWFNNCLNYFKNSSQTIILTWTNKQINAYNVKSRQVLLKKNNSELKEFEIGDQLILNDFYNNNDDNNNDNNDILYASQQVKVIKVEEVMKGVEPFYEALPDKLKKAKHYNLIEDKYRKVIQLCNKKTVRKYNVCKLRVHKLNYPLEKEYTMYVIKKESINQLNTDKLFVAQKIRELRVYFAAILKDQINMIDKSVIKPLWKNWNNRFISQFANTNISFAVTTHRAQGSTFYDVFLDANDIFLNNNDDEAKRCLYTAVSRTSNEVHILI